MLQPLHWSFYSIYRLKETMMQFLEPSFQMVHSRGGWWQSTCKTSISFLWSLRKKRPFQSISFFLHSASQNPFNAKLHHTIKGRFGSMESTKITINKLLKSIFAEVTLLELFIPFYFTMLPFSKLF